MPAAPEANLARLPDEILVNVFTRLYDAEPDIAAFNFALYPTTFSKGDPPEQNTPGAFGALARTCRRFYLLVTPTLYETLFVYLPRQPKRVHRLIRALNQNPQIGHMCKRAFVVRDTDESDSWAPLAMVSMTTTEPPPVVVQHALNRLSELYKLLNSYGVRVRMRHAQWEDAV
jgi:hypothetical protein